MTALSKGPFLPTGTLADIVEFHDYWAALPKVSLIPHLNDYFDHAPPHLQPNVAVADVASATDVRVRLYGTGLADLTGSDQTQANVKTLYADFLKAGVGQLAWMVVSRPFGYLGIRSTRTRAGRAMHKNKSTRYN